MSGAGEAARERCIDERSCSPRQPVPANQTKFVRLSRSFYTGIETRFVIGLLLLKHIRGLSDESVCERWVYDPYFQYFTGEEFFQHVFLHERSDLSHWRKRLGDKLELLLAESVRVAHATGALRTQDLARVTIATTVQPKNVAFPTDAKRLHAAIRRQLKRRSAVEPVIGHRKSDEHLGRSHLKGRAGNAANAILSAVGYNLRRVLAWFKDFLRQIFKELRVDFMLQSAFNPAS